MDERNDSKAVAYLRRSRVDDTRTGTVSYEAQEAAVRTMAGRWGHDDVQILVDWGRSGGSEKRRPGYLQLRVLIEAGQVTDVFSYDLSRLTRSLEEWIKLATLCRDRGVRIHLSKEGTFDFSTASGEMLANILASVAQAVRRWASERSSETISSLRARGATIGRKPYGGRPGEDLEAVKAAYLEAGSFYGAARLLNDSKHAAPNAVLGIKRRAKDGQSTKPARWVASSVAWIIRHQAPGMASERATTAGPQRPGRYALQGLVRCHCGRLLSPFQYRSGRKVYTTYRCSGGRVDPTHGRPYAVPEHVLLDWARKEGDQLSVPGDTAQLREETNTKRAELDARRERILDMYEGGHVDRDERDRRLAPVYAELERLDAAAGVMFLAKIPSIDWDATPDSLNGVLRALWARIDVGPDLKPVSAVWRVPEWRSA
jgi:DNA invertase Pin-like site-specific DNA recombinase